MHQRNGWHDLAAFGGKARFDQPLHVNRPNAINRDRLVELIDGMLASRWYSDGKLVREFEERIAKVAGVRHCVATCNGTLALQMTFRSLGITGEVIVPSFTYIATVQALRWLGITPVFCDVNPATHNIEPVHVERLITPRTRGILGVHLWGQPCEVDVLAAIADRHRLALVFDAAHALGSTCGDRPVGSFGVAEVFSFHATKFVNTAEGGAITTNDDALASALRAERRFGFDQNDQNVDLGTNGKMSEICAAMGLTSLESFGELVAANRATYEQYQVELAGIPGISLLPQGDGKRNYQYIVTLVDEAKSGISRDDLLQVLQAEGILAKRYFHPGCHQLVRGDSIDVSSQLPVTKKLVNTVLVLPGGASVERQEVKGVCETVRIAVEHGAQIRDALNDRLALKNALG